jgi:redox-sensitive bicupin YhaK (pirin superfamily)
LRDIETAVRFDQMSALTANEPACLDEGSRCIQLVIEARPRDLGGFSVRRSLPAARRRLVGPFVFFDHMGPATLAVGTGLDVRPHPHIELATVTYLFAGEIDHRDSLGSMQTIRPGDVNWMVAGRGIVHSERSPKSARETGAHVHGIQSWVALPSSTSAPSRASSITPRRAFRRSTWAAFASR